jgi:hypothetical protein
MRNLTLRSRRCGSFSAARKSAVHRVWQPAHPMTTRRPQTAREKKTPTKFAYRGRCLTVFVVAPRNLRAGPRTTTSPRTTSRALARKKREIPVCASLPINLTGPVMKSITRENAGAIVASVPAATVSALFWPCSIGQPNQPIRGSQITVCGDLSGLS